MALGPPAARFPASEMGVADELAGGEGGILNGK